MLLGLLAVGCGPRTTAGPVGPVEPRSAEPARHGPAAGNTLVIKHPALHYRAGGPATDVAPEALGPLLRSIGSWSKERGLRLILDGRLHQTARALLGLRNLDHLTAKALGFVLQGHGVAEPTARLVAVDLDRPPRAIRASLFGRLEAALRGSTYNRLGGAVRRLTADTTRVVLVLLRSHVTAEAVLRQPRPGSSVLLRGRLAPGFARPSAVVTLPDGKTHRPRLVTATDGSFHAVVPLLGGEGRFQVEIMATGPQGPEVLYNVPLYCGITPPTAYVLRPAIRRVRPRRPGRLKRAARQLFDLINQARKGAGVAALRWDEQLARVAVAHSRELCRARSVRHHSTATGTALDRVRRAGVRARWVGENVGRAGTVREVHRNLLGSPAHRANLLRPPLTHVGVGVCSVRATGPGEELYVTELFIER